MTHHHRRAIWFAAAVSLFVLGIFGGAFSPDRAGGSEPSRFSGRQVVADHEVAVPAPPVADRSPLDLRQVHSKLLLFAWLGVAFVAALQARTAGRALEQRTLRSGSTVEIRHRFDRGPPAGAFA